MRVVSQKKDASYDFDRTEFRTSYECISATFDGRTLVIGKYATQIGRASCRERV